MGWWRIDPETGMPAKDARSALSRPPDVVLLNAVPGVDDQAGACYTGDGPWDMAGVVADELWAAVGDAEKLTEEEARGLLMDRVVPARLTETGAETTAHLLPIVDAFWRDIDWCYGEDWQRPALPTEKRWVCEQALYYLAKLGSG
jgi:hypothetical protein